MGDLKEPRRVRTFVVRSGRMTAGQKKAIDLYGEKWLVAYDPARRLNSTELFGNDRPLVIEIGFGMGDATAEIARNRSETNFLGFEVYPPGAARLLALIEEFSLSNVRVMRRDASEALPAMIDDDSVSAFHIFFPDPWQKKRHHKRRLMRPQYVSLFARKLEPRGYIYFVTDWEEYALDAKESLDAEVLLKNRFDGFAPRQEWRPETKFEARALRAGRQIYELIYEKKR